MPRRDPDDEDAELIICAGPPICLLDGDAAVASAQRGCPWCEHIRLHPDGSETRFRIGGTA